MNAPHWVARTTRPPDAHMIEEALATIQASIPAPLLVLLALHLDTMRRERAYGYLGTQFHMKAGSVRSLVIDRHTAHYSDEEPKP